MQQAVSQKIPFCAPNFVQTPAVRVRFLTNKNVKPTMLASIEAVMPMTLRKSLKLGLVAEESEKTKKARAKLKEKLDRAEKKVKGEGLEKKSQEIAEWIERHSHDRVVVKKDISLFDQNRNSAKMSRSLEKMAEELAEQLKIL